MGTKTQTSISKTPKNTKPLNKKSYKKILKDRFNMKKHFSPKYTFNINEPNI